jgi:hypothetical protein
MPYGFSVFFGFLKRSLKLRAKRKYNQTQSLMICWGSDDDDKERSEGAHQCGVVCRMSSLITSSASEPDNT